MSSHLLALAAVTSTLQSERFRNGLVTSTSPGVRRLGIYLCQLGTSLKLHGSSFCSILAANVTRMSLTCYEEIGRVGRVTGML